MSDVFWTNFFIAVVALINLAGTVLLALINLRTQTKVDNVRKDVNGIVHETIAYAEKTGHAAGKLEAMEKIHDSKKGAV